VPLAAVLLPICLKRELAELAWISVVLFSSLALFVLVNLIQLSFDSHFEPLGLSTEILKPKLEWETISALSVTMLAYSYQQNVFPIFSELKNKNNVEYQKVSARGLPLTGTIYFCVGIICSLMFGNTL
jgi:amino acid permease